MLRNLQEQEIRKSSFIHDNPVVHEPGDRHLQKLLFHAVPGLYYNCVFHFRMCGQNRHLGVDS